MYSVKKHRDVFLNEAQELKNILEQLANQEASFERDVFIEGAFLRFVVIWENFCEGYVLRSLCGVLTTSKGRIIPKVTRSKNIQEAFQRLSKKQRSWDSEYLNWLDTKQVRRILIEYFHHKSRIHDIYSDPNTMSQIITVRNHIAHKSRKTLTEFQDMIRNQVGYLRDPNAGISKLLLLNKRGGSVPFYEIYLNKYIVLANYLCK